jgi:hypothetical protein
MEAINKLYEIVEKVKKEWLNGKIIG